MNNLNESQEPEQWDDEPVRIHAYDSSWPAKFEQERTALDNAIGEYAVGGIHHVGSTAVPGLDAKPIIDILVGVDELEGSKSCFESLRRLGYLYAPYRTDVMHWFCKPDPSHRTHHLHLVPKDSPLFADELAFRDRLRQDADVAAKYVALKRQLADRYEHDRESYTESKAAFIKSVVESGQPQIPDPPPM